MQAKGKIKGLAKSAAIPVWDLRIAEEFLVALRFYPTLDSSSLYNKIRDTICPGIDDGSFGNLLRQNAQTLNALELLTTSFPAGSCSVGPYTELNSNSNTNSASKASDANLSSGITALVVIAALLGLIMLCCVCFCGIRYYQEEEKPLVDEDGNPNASMYSGISATGEEFEIGDNTVVMFVSSDQNDDDLGFTPKKSNDEAEDAQVAAAEIDQVERSTFSLDDFKDL